MPENSTIHAPMDFRPSNTLSAAVRRLKARHGLSNIGLSEKTGLDVSQVQRLINNGKWGLSSLAFFLRTFPDLEADIVHFLKHDPAATHFADVQRRRHNG